MGRFIKNESFNAHFWNRSAWQSNNTPFIAYISIAQAKWSVFRLTKVQNDIAHSIYRVEGTTRSSKSWLIIYMNLLTRRSLIERVNCENPILDGLVQAGDVRFLWKSRRRAQKLTRVPNLRK